MDIDFNRHSDFRICCISDVDFVMPANNGINLFDIDLIKTCGLSAWMDSKMTLTKRISVLKEAMADLELTVKARLDEIESRQGALEKSTQQRHTQILSRIEELKTTIRMIDRFGTEKR